MAGEGEFVVATHGPGPIYVGAEADAAPEWGVEVANDAGEVVRFTGNELYAVAKWLRAQVLDGDSSRAGAYGPRERGA